MNLHIKDKFKLTDLASLGTRARKYVRPYVMISDAEEGIFHEGDLLDANATYNLVEEKIQEHDDDSVKCIVITQSEYDALEVYEPNAIYFIVGDQNV